MRSLNIKNASRKRFNRTIRFMISMLLFFTMLSIMIGTVSADTPADTVASGSSPIAIGVNPVTNKMYVANNGSDDITVIDGATNAITTVSVGSDPCAVGVNPITNRIYVVNRGSNNVTVIDGVTNATTTVAVGTQPCAVGVNSVTNKIYVTNHDSNNVTVIDGASNSTVTVAAGINPCAVSVNPITNKIYVANYGSDNITVIDGTTDVVAETVDVGSRPQAVGVNSATNNIYVANLGDSKVTVVDGATDDVTETVDVGTNPCAVGVNPYTNKIFVANRDSNNVTVIDGETNMTATVDTWINPCAVGVNPVTNKIYVANRGSSNVIVIDGETNITTIMAAGTNPCAVGVNPVTNKMYVINNGSDNATVIDGATNSAETVAAGTNSYVLEVNPATNKIYAANRGSNNVTVIDGATNMTTTVAVGTYPCALGVNAVTNQIYVANRNSNNVTVIDGATNMTTTVAVGTYPYAIEVNPVTNKIYVANSISNNVTVIDGATNLTTTVDVGTAPWAMGVNPVTNKIYVANYNSNNVTVIDGATDEVAATLDTGWRFPWVVEVNPATNKIYVANSDGGNVAVIDGATNSTKTVYTGGQPCSVGVNPVTNKIYVANMLSSTVSVIDGTIDDVAATTVYYGMMMAPCALGVNPVTNKIYVADSDAGTIFVIDGTTNAATTAAYGMGFTLGVNPVTNKVYAAGGGYDVVTVVEDQPIQSINPYAEISPLTGDVSADTTPRFTLSASGAIDESAVQLWYQTDTQTGKWKKAPGSGTTASVVLGTLSPGTHILYVMATDGQAATVNSSSSPVTGKIAAYVFTVVTTPIIETADLTGCKLHAPYSLTLTADNGVEPYTWSAEGLPQGMNLDPSTGEISGSPEAAGDFIPRITVIDSMGSGTTRIFSLPIEDLADGSGTISVTPASTTAGKAVNPIEFTYTLPSGGPADGAISIEIPGGWTIPSVNPGDPGHVTSDKGTVSVSGQIITVTGVSFYEGENLKITYNNALARVEGKYTFLAKSRLRAGGIFTALKTAALPSISVSKNTEAPVWPTDAALTITDRSSTSVTLSWPAATDYIEITGYNIYKDNVRVSTVAGTVNSTFIAGLTAGGSYTFEVEPFDAAGNIGSRLTAATDTNNYLRITTTLLPSATLGSAYNGTGADLSASGGTGGYTWSVTGLDGSGLNLSADGKISGTPTSIGTWVADVTVTDSSGAFTSKSYTINTYYPAGTGKYTMSPSADTVYTTGTNADGIVTMTVNSGVTGFRIFTVNAVVTESHSGNEVAIFVQMRNGVQIAVNATAADFDRIDRVKAGFNVKPGDIIKVYMVDELNNDAGFNPTLLQ